MILFAFLIKYHFLTRIAYPIIWPLLFVVISIVVGVLVHYLIERPILAWLRGCLRSLAPATEPRSNSVDAGRAGETNLILDAEKPL